MGNANRKDWINTLVEDNPLVEQVQHNPVTTEAGERHPFEIKITCSKLKVENGFYLCSVYQNRPKICSDYNCFEHSNRLKRRPEAWDKVKKAIKEAHGIDVEYENEVTSDPYHIRLANKIKAKEIF